jgi:endonuclease/exonuclease/phosphatase family metal-dependent hydrolase
MTACAAQPRMVDFTPRAEVADCRTVEAPRPVAVRWVVPDEPRDRARLDSYCAAIGPVVVQPAPADGRGHLTADEIVVINWNTYLGQGDIEAFVAALRRGDFTGGAPVRTFVLLLQEVFRSEILGLARAFDVHAVYAPTRRSDSDISDRGNAILSTFPTGDLIVTELPFEKHRRIAVGAEIHGAASDGTAWRLHVVNAHFDNNVGLLRGGPGATRRRYARALIESLQTVPPPIVIGADLNTWWGDDEPAVKDLRRAFPDADPAKTRETWRGPLGVGNKLDYVFARGTGSRLPVRRLDDRFGSDHWPLLAVVKVR